MASILILVGTESGNAQMVADALQPVLKTAGHSVAVSDRAAGAADFLGNDLSGHRYGIIALGDMTYQDTFCGAGKKLDDIFAVCGARRIGERLEVDASEQPLPDEEALTWIEGWKALV